MKSFLSATTLSLMLAFSFIANGAVPDVPANAPMPVLFQTVQNGPTYPVLAKKGDQYFQVFAYAKGQPYFTDADGKWHFVSGATTDETFPIYYVSGNASQPQAVPQGRSDGEVRDELLAGNSEAKDHLVCWGGYGWYGYDYPYYSSYSYYPSYSYGYGYNGGSYYGGYYGGYYGAGNYGYYGYGQPYYYSGYGYLMNNWYW